jgi:hypothetical protein
MWAEDEQLKDKARRVVSLIADYRGGCADVTEVIQEKIPSGTIFRSDFMPVFMEEMKKKTAEALQLWLIITRLLKGTILTIAEDHIDVWTSIPKVPPPSCFPLRSSIIFMVIIATTQLSSSPFRSIISNPSSSLTKKSTDTTEHHSTKPSKPLLVLTHSSTPI